MATTTNYSWTTPDDTALVKDGASAIRTLGTAIDTTTKNLNPSTTLGDIEYRSSSANTNTRLGIGSSGQVLTVSGGVPAWTTISSGAKTLLASGSLSGSSLALTSISGSYKDLYLEIFDLSLSSANSLNMTFMGLTSDYRYTTKGTYGTNTQLTDGYIGSTNIPLNFGDFLDTDNNNAFVIKFYDYAASSVKLGDYVSIINARFSSPGVYMSSFGNVNASAKAALTSITITTPTTFDNGTYKLFGVN